jgi:hypothetical protein
MTQHQSALKEIFQMRRYLFGWRPPNEREAELQRSYGAAILRMYNEYNKPGYKRPVFACGNRARAFALFDQGYRPRDITRRQVGFIKRKCLYVYYSEWQTIAQAETAILLLLRELCEAERERRAREWRVAPSIQVSTRRTSLR